MNRNSLTKSLHTVTAVSRLALHLMPDTAVGSDAYWRYIGKAMEILGLGTAWDKTDATMAGIFAALCKLDSKRVPQ